MMHTLKLDAVCQAILGTPIRKGHEARLIAISGIDSSGKGYTAAALDRALRSEGANVALIGIDGWLNLPSVRFSKTDPGRHFYKNAFRFDEMFSELVDPLVRDGFVDLTANFTEETANQYRAKRYHFADIDTVLLEGIFLLRRDLRQRYDLKIWIECSFATALRRATARAQEGLQGEDTVAAYGAIYFPAQEVHFCEDDPMDCAEVIFDNDANPPDSSR
jgi:uridine kinase